MIKPVKRTYTAPLRTEAARRTRDTILEVARGLFIEHGYPATTMAAIAKEAGVSLDTVYASVGTKPVVFRLLIERALSGSDDPVPALERDYVREIVQEPDARRKIETYASAVRQIQERLSPLFSVLQIAAATDREFGELWTEISERRAQNMRLFIADLAETGMLRSDITGEEAADTVWAMNSSEFYVLLVRQRGWSPDQFEHWLADAWKRLLLVDP